MEAARGSWADVKDGTYIQDKNGVTWKVLRSTPDLVRLVNRDQKMVDLRRPPGSREVTFLVPTETEARFTLAKALGARVLASRDASGYYRTPVPETWNLEDATWHMSRFHRIDVSHLTLEEIRDLHETSEPTCQHEHTEDT